MKNHLHFLLAIAGILLLPASKISATIYEAENATLYHAVTETKNSGYIGDSYVNFDNETGSYIEFTISMAEAGTQTLDFRFANNGTAARTMTLYLNGINSGQTLLFDLTGAWTSWTTESLSLDLVKGINKIRLLSSTSDGGPNLDNLDVSGTAGSSYNLQLTSTGPGSISSTPQGTVFFEGEIVTLTASPDLLGEFEGWSGDLTGTISPVQITMDADKNISASFTETVLELGDPNFDMIGYATVDAEGYATTTGGAGGRTTTVTTLEELLDFASEREGSSTPGILYIKGKISAPSTTVVTIKHGANLTILGEGDFGELENVGLKIWDYNNVIVRNMKIHEVFYPNDALTVDECQHVWIDHNEFFSKIGSGIGVDTYDGLLDIKNGSRYVTASWNIIHHHMKTSLIGHTDNSGQASVDSEFKITYHHNYFHDTDGRNPSIRFGSIHLFNNYFENISDYGIAIRQGAHAKLENNHYHNVVIPITTDKFDGPEGFACETGTIYSGGSSASDNSITQVDCDFWNDLPYTYELEPANTNALMVQAFGGVGIISTGTSVSLSGISVNIGALSPSFNPLITHYDLVVPDGTNSLEITATTADEGSVISGDGIISSIPSTVEIIVSAADESSSENYSITISFETLSSNARLSSLSYNSGTLDPTFTPDIQNYVLTVPAGTSSVSLMADAEDPGATVAGVGTFTSLPEVAEIIVTAADGSIKTYEIEIVILTETGHFETDNFSYYPNPVSDRLYIKNLSAKSVELIEANGRIINTINIDSDFIELDMSSLTPGIYILRINFADKILVNKIIKR